jgi:hypothetical protein
MEDSMDRRDFLKKSIGGCIVAGTTVAFGDYAKLLAAPPISPAAYDLVAVKGGEPEVMFDKAIASQFTSSFWARMCSSTSRF